MKYKTTKELIEYLSTFPPDTPVVMGDYSYDVEEGYCPVQAEVVLTTETNRIANYWDDEERKRWGPVFIALKIGH